jgi:ABC-type nitrate/sulfonate/bicarbonate transport system permease component
MIGPKLPTSRLISLTVAGAFSFLALWTALALSGITPRIFLPAPWEVVQRIAQLIVEPFAGHVLQEHLVASLGRFGMGYLLAICIGLPLGLLMAWFPWVDRLVTPLFEAIRFVAPIAWVPFAALWFGTGIGGPVLIIFMGAFPPVLINTYRGAKQVDLKYIEAALMLGASAFRTMTQVLLPAAMPSIIAGLRISAGLGWQSLVGAELIVAASGVGNMMVKGQAAISTSTVMAGMVAIGIVGLLIDIALRKVQFYVERSRGIA